MSARNYPLGDLTMEGDFITIPQERASQACLACRKQKRKCDKALPACTLCSRMRRSCNYTDPGSERNADDLTLLRERVRHLEKRLESVSTSADIIPRAPSRWSPGRSSTSSSTVSAAVTSSFPSLFFLDIEVFKQVQASIPRPSIPVPQELKAALGATVDMQAVVGTYFMTIHDWLPIVSKTRLYRHLSSPYSELSADLSLLFASMKMIISHPQEAVYPAESPLYCMVKQFLTTVEAGGLLSIHVLQAAVLIAAYEIGHGIYPAAYLSTGHCAKLGQTLGLHDRQYTPQVLPKPSTWAGAEEYIRTWYAVLILDRYVNIGSHGHPLSSGEFLRGAVLPCDDGPWDRGEVTASQPIFVTSPTSVNAGAYARTCQAAHLLGRVIGHRDDQEIESAFRFTTAMQIHATLEALSNILSDELKTSPNRLSTAFALLFSARLALYDPYACTVSNHGDNTVEETQMQAISINGLKETANDVMQYSQYLGSHLRFDVSNASPLICDSLYQAAATFVWLKHENGDPQTGMALTVITDLLELLHTRWRVAGEYLKILELTEQKLFGPG